MKPKNFPERKNQRRKVALARLQTRWEGRGVPPNILEEMLFLKDRIMNSARHVQTKKKRAGLRKKANE